MHLDHRLNLVEAELLESVSADELIDFVSRIAAEVRLSGSPEERRALDWARKQLEGWGYRAQIIEHDAYVSLPGPATLAIDGLGSLGCITHAFAVSTPPEGLSGAIIDVGGGSEAEWARPAVRGRIALVDGLATPDQARRAAAAGSIAQIFINDDHLHEMTLAQVWGSPTPEQLSLYPQSPAVSVVQADGARIRAALAGGLLHAQIVSTVETGWRTLPILEAQIDGVAEPGRFVLFSGHIDSWHYGAMDNGSANAAMLHIARLLAGRRRHLRRSLRICMWSGHSHARSAGSAWYADHRWADLYEHCVAHINIDSVGGQGATMLSEGYCMAETFGLGRELVGRYGGQEYHGARVGRAGDQSFTGIGVPSLFMTLSEQPPATGVVGASALLGGRSGGLGWWWHTPEDTLDKLAPALLARDTRIYAVAVLRCCAEPLLPFDYAAAAAELDGFVAQYQEALGTRFDLGPARAQSRTLSAEAAVLQEELDGLRRRLRGGAPEPHNLAAINGAIMALGRATIPLNYTAAGPFSHDPALAMPPFPLLADARRLAAAAPGSDEARHITVGLKRGLNQAVWGLRQARAAVAAAHRLGSGMRELD